MQNTADKALRGETQHAVTYYSQRQCRVVMYKTTSYESMQCCEIKEKRKSRTGTVSRFRNPTPQHACQWKGQKNGKHIIHFDMFLYMECVNSVTFSILLTDENMSHRVCRMDRKTIALDKEHFRF